MEVIPLRPHSNGTMTWIIIMISARNCGIYQGHFAVSSTGHRPTDSSTELQPRQQTRSLFLEQWAGPRGKTSLTRHFHWSFHASPPSQSMVMGRCSPVLAAHPSSVATTNVQTLGSLPVHSYFSSSTHGRRMVIVTGSSSCHTPQNSSIAADALPLLLDNDFMAGQWRGVLRSIGEAEHDD